MKRWTTMLSLSAIALTACQDTSGPVQQELQLRGPAASKSEEIPGAYIVTLRDDVQDVDDVAKSLGIKGKGKLKHLYKSALKGFAIDDLSDEAVALLAADPRVTLVEADQVMTAIATQSGATWGLDRVDQRPLPLDGSYTYATDGTGVTVYIIDTGINFGHSDFGGRAVKGTDAVTSGGSAADCNGHGTHVAGTVGGTTYGLAKKASLVAVRVLDCGGSGSTSGVVAGIDWVTANKALPAAANMSLGGGYSATLNAAVARSVAAGVTYAIAAGNSGANACNYSPASEPSAITVGATASNDGFASWSNRGSCVDVNAPGVSITSDWIGSTSATNTISGTSMATPHVAGAAALYLAANPGATPAQVTSAITSTATSGAIVSLPAGTVNLLLYTGSAGGGGGGGGSVGSIASFSFTCNKLNCTFDASSSTGATKYNWNFGDNRTGTGVKKSHGFKKNRSYTVTLNTTPAGAQSTASKTVTCGPVSCS
jgi:subtilisin family serine protease